MKLLIRDKSQWITFIHNTEELREFIENYLPGRHLTIGDISVFHKTMLNMLLKFCEDNPDVDLYSSKDIPDPILASRFTIVQKSPLSLSSSQSEQDFLSSDHSFTAAIENLGQLSTPRKLLAPSLDNQLIRLYL